MRRCRAVFCLLLIFGFLFITHHSSVNISHAQSATSTLSGTVEDERGALIPGASVTVENVGTSLRRQTTTNGEGYFTFPLLPPSAYTIRVENEGFAPIQINEVVLNVGDQKAIQIQLKAGDVTARVQVTSDAPLINESPAVGTVVDRQFIANLPLNGRSFQTLISLTPGVVLTKSSVFESGQFSVNGQRANANYFTVDGVSANVDIKAGLSIGQAGGGSLPGLTVLGGTNNLVSVDALQEFSILTSSYAPEFGRTPGAQVSIVTRSGTNDFHGSIFDYIRNDVFDANDWFANSRSLSRPPLRQNDFGGTYGGPVLLPRFGEGGRQPLYSGKNKTFFFLSYEGLRVRQPQVAITAVPSVASRTNAVAQVRPFLNALPFPNGRNLAGGFAEASASYSNPSTLNATSFRLDHSLNSKLTFFGRYNYAPSDTVTRSTSGLSNLSVTRMKTQTLTVGAAATIAKTIINDFRANWSKSNGGLVGFLDNFGGAIPIPDRIVFPSFASFEDSVFQFSVFGGGSATYTVGTSTDNLQRQINIVDALSVTVGSHQLKFGFDYRRLSPVYEPRRYTQLIQSSLAAVIQGRSAIAVIFADETSRTLLFHNFSAFSQDTWRVTPRLTLTYGLRWEHNPPPYEENGLDPYTVKGLDNPATMVLAPKGTALWNTTYYDFAPRVGVAYDISQSDGRETVLRGGVGIFYDLGNGQAANGAGFAFPYQRNKFLIGPQFPISSALAQPPPFSLNPPYGNLHVFDPELKLPYSIQWNVAVEQSLGLSQTISASYVAAVGRRLLRQEVLVNPNPNFLQVFVGRNRATSDYHALQVQFQRRLARGLQALTSYTWSHSIDSASADSSDNVSEERIDVSQDRGPSDFDIRHSFSAGLTYNIPASTVRGVASALRNWSVDTIIRSRSATPVNILVGSDVLGVGFILGQTVSRPNLVPGVPLYIEDPTVAGGMRINKNAFVSPPAGQQGTLGRNALRGFPASQLDFALRRQFKLKETLNLQIRAEIFNVFNHPNFADPINTLNNSLFGQSTSMLGRSLGSGGASGGLSPLYQIGGPRSVQLAVKLQF